MLYTTTSLECMGVLGLYRNRISPRQNPGSIEPVSTTTIWEALVVMYQTDADTLGHTGDSLPVTTTKPFQSMSAEVTMSAAMGW